MHTDFPMLALLSDGQRIVEVLGILRIDGAGKDIAEILTAPDFLRGNARINLLGSLLHILRILIRQTVLRQDGVHLDGVVALFSEHVNHLANHVLRLSRRPLDNLHHRLVASLAALQFLLGNKDVVGKDVSLGHQEGIVFFHL